jgi:hypothetical protein
LRWRSNVGRSCRPWEICQKVVDGVSQAGIAFVEPGEEVFGADVVELGASVVEDLFRLCRL